MRIESLIRLTIKCKINLNCYYNPIESVINPSLAFNSDIGSLEDLSSAQFVEQVVTSIAIMNGLNGICLPLGFV